MPILKPPEDGAPLRQGDLLEGVSLFYGGLGGPKATQKHSHVVVLARNCNAMNDAHVLVAEVKATSDVEALAKDRGTSAADRMMSVSKGLVALRDGRHTDRFYLGNLPGGMGRLWVLLDRLHTVVVAKDGRGEWLARNRVASMAAAAVDDLCYRLHCSVSKNGYDDEAWLCDSDLDLLISLGQNVRGEAGTDREVAANLGNHPPGSSTSTDQALALLERLEIEKTRRNPPAAAGSCAPGADVDADDS